MPILPHIANFDDLDPLDAEPAVDLIRVRPGTALPGDADLVLLPGSKATIADLAALRAAGFDIDIAAHLRRGGKVLGLCGGYQMLGRTIADPDGFEGPPGKVDGLGLIDVDTTLSDEKRLEPVHGTTSDGMPFSGYEMHMGVTEGPDRARPFAKIWRRLTGRRGLRRWADDRHLCPRVVCRRPPACEPGCGRFAAVRATLPTNSQIERTLDALADHLAAHIDLDSCLNWRDSNQPRR